MAVVRYMLSMQLTSRDTNLDHLGTLILTTLTLTLTLTTVWVGFFQHLQQVQIGILGGLKALKTFEDPSPLYMNLKE